MYMYLIYCLFKFVAKNLYKVPGIMYMNISGLEKETYLMPGILMVRIKIYLCFSV